MSKKKPTEPTGLYYVFSKRPSSACWYYDGEHDTKEDAEDSMEQRGEQEHVEYMVIKGDLVETRDGIPTYPRNIIE